MVLDNLHDTLIDYEIMGGKIARALAWLRSTDLKALEPGKEVVIDGERVFARVIEGSSKPLADCLFETHRLYIDIQVIVTGTEIQHWAPLKELTQVKKPYNFDSDVVFFEDPERSIPIELREGDMAIYWPADGHKPGCAVDAPAPVKKVVVKVAV